MQPDSSWAGLLEPIVRGWFPTLPGWIVTLLIGTVVSIAYGLVRKTQPAPKPAATTPNPVHVAIPAVVTTLLSGWPGVVAGAMGEGIKRAGGALVTWFMARVVRR